MLRWSHDWGNTSEHWETLLEMGRQVPEPYLARPEILPHSLFYWVGFCELSTERQIGMAVGPIPRSKAKEYALDEDLDDDEWDFFWKIIRDLDAENLKLVNRKSDDKNAPTNIVSANDPEGMKQHMERLAKKQKKKR